MKVNIYKSLHHCPTLRQRRDLNLGLLAGGAENAGLENAGVAKMQGSKTRHQTAGVENAGLENTAPDCRGGKRGTGKCRSLKVWKVKIS